MTEKGMQIYQGETGEVVFDFDAKNETIWATQEEISRLFGIDRTVVGRHLRNIFGSGELDEKVSCAFFAHDTRHGALPDRTKTVKVKYYNLDAIISVGYRVNSGKATKFRIWATSVLKKYMTDGVAVNERRLKVLAEKKEIQKLHDVENMMGIVRRLTAHSLLDAGEANGVLEVISRYAGSFKTLQEYDEGHIDLRFLNKKKAGKELTAEMCEQAVEQLRENVGGSDLFGKKRGGLFDGSLTAIFQSFDGHELYPSVSEKAANLLYFIIKDHPFYDGNKRIGALLFILFLTLNNYHLTASGETKISDRALTAIALLISESEPKEKELIVSLVCKLLE